MDSDYELGLTGLNHITVAVSDLDRSFEFYVNVLGFTPKARWKMGAYLSLGDLWFVLICTDVCTRQDYTHIALSINNDAFPSFKEYLEEYGVKQWQENSSEGDSLYFCDPDGHRLELHVGDLKSRLKFLKEKPYEGLVLY